MPGAYSASIGLWVDLGSSQERIQVNGVSHFFEHMVFKGTRQRNALQIAREIEERGGSLNAYTTRESTCFYARVVKEDFDLALDTILDLVMNPLLSEDDVRKERQVIAEEIRSYDDAPDEVAHDLFAARHFQGKGLALPITGTLKTLRQIGRPQLRSHHARILKKSRLWIVAAGNLDHADLVRQCQERLNLKKESQPIRFVPRRGSGQGGVILKKDVQQCNLVLGTSLLPAQNERERLSLSMMNMIFGDGMSSRLFQRIREDHGLAYSVYSAVDVYRPCQVLTIALGTDPRRQAKSLQLVREEARQLLLHGVTCDEIDRARTAMLGGMKLGLDSPSNRMNRLARQLIRQGEWVPMRELEKTIHQLNEDDIMQQIDAVFAKGKWAAAAVVPRQMKSFQLEPWLDFS